MSVGFCDIPFFGTLPGLEDVPVRESIIRSDGFVRLDKDAQNKRNRGFLIHFSRKSSSRIRPKEVPL